MSDSTKPRTYYKARNLETGKIRMIRAVSNAHAREHLLRRTWSVELATKDDLAAALDLGIKLEDADKPDTAGASDE